MSTADTAPPPTDRFAVRLAGVGAVVFLANFGLLVLQLVAGRLLSPYIGSALGTWTSVIAAFLTGIALGNFLGGRLSERPPSARRLALVLLAGVAATLWMVAFPMFLTATDAHTVLGISYGRIPILAFLLCLPVATVLSLLTPLAIRFGVPDVAHTGSVAGTVFALSSLGCVLGNYLTGFVFIPELMVNTIVCAVAGLLAATGLAALLVGGGQAAVEPTPPRAARVEAASGARPTLPLPIGFAVVFLCSFAGMSLEMAASRMMATLVGVSLFTWTGVIGVMLAGTTLGNWAGGKLADRAHRRGSPDRPQVVLAMSLLAAAVCSVLVLVVFSVVSSANPPPFTSSGPINQVLGLTFVQFFVPMALLGTISPQVIRLCVRDVRTAGQTAGRIYAVSTAGAIAGTFAAGYLLIHAMGMKGTVLLAAVLPCAAVTLLVRVWKEPAMLYVTSAVGGAFLGGALLLFRGKGEILVETDYYAISVKYTKADPPKLIPLANDLGAAVGGMPGVKTEVIGLLTLDVLLHSAVNLQDPTYFRYRHEQVQLEAVYAAADRKPDGQRVLVIGGGGYTLPRAVRTLVPTAAVDVVEIDPGVTKVAYDHLGLDPKLDIRSFHRDGRQFVAEQAEANSYDVISLDAVNDYSVPGHLLTKECNDAVKRTLAKNGVYLVTVIDLVGEGKLWKAAFHTLKRSFGYVYFTLPAGDVEGVRQSSVAAVRVAARRLGRPVVEADQITLDDLGRAAAADRLGRPLQADDVPTKDDALRGEAYRLSVRAYREAAIRLGKPTVAEDEVTADDAVRVLDRNVIVLYASDTPLDQTALRKLVLARPNGVASDTFVLSDATTADLLAREKELVLTDQYCPVDNLMATVFLRR